MTDLRRLLFEKGNLDGEEAGAFEAEAIEAIHEVNRAQFALEEAQHKRDNLIRLLADEHRVSYRALAEFFDLSFQRVAQIVKGKAAPIEEDQ